MSDIFSKMTPEEIKFMVDGYDIEIQKLQSENAELKKQRQWISVDDELPELNKTVMIDSGSGFDFARFNGDYWTRKAWPLGCTPKYWMPLPTPPEGD